MFRRLCCKYCSKSWHGDPSKAVLREHRETHAQMNTSTNDCFQRECRACDQVFSFTEVTLWTQHVTTQHGSRPAPGAPASRPQEKRQCSFCYELINLENLKIHVAEKHSRDCFRCGICPLSFSEMSEALSHMDFEHQVPAKTAEIKVVKPADLRGVVCLVCKWVMYGGDEDAMEFHFHLNHNEQKQTNMLQYFCRVCGKDKAFRDLVKELPGHMVHLIYGSFRRYENQKPGDLEAKLVKDLDKFDMILQAWEYEKRDKRGKYLQQFFDSTATVFKTVPALKWQRELLAARDNYADE